MTKETINPTDERTTAELITEYSSLLWHWAWLLILLGLIAAGTAFFVSKRTTPVYQTSTMIMLNGAPGVSSDSYTSLYFAEQLMATYAQTMTTKPMLDAVSSKLGFSFPGSSIQVQTIANTSLMKITVKGSDPDRVAMIANTMFSVFAEQLQSDQATRFSDSKTSIENQLATLNQQIQNTTDDLIKNSQLIQDTQTSLDALNQQIADEIKLSGAESVTSEERNQQTQYQADLLQAQLEKTQLQSTYSQYQNSYYILTQSFNQIKLAEAQSTSLVIQKDPAVAPTVPVSPQPIRDASLAAIIGLFTGAGIIFLIEFLDDSLRDPEEITRKWGIPVLGMIVNFNSSNGNNLITEKEPRSPVSEAFRSIRTNLQFASVSSPLHTILVTSSSPEDGKTTIAGNLACVFAQVGRKVVVVDSDLRRPRMHKLLELHNRFGLTDLFIRSNEYLGGAIQPTEVKNLNLLSSGSLPPNPSELISSQRMVDILQNLESQFDVVILDAPPSLVVTDANVLANHADGVLLVVRPSFTKRAAIRHTIEQLRQVNANIIGVVVNGVDVKKSRYGYYSYYRGYYSSYGYGYGYYAEDGKSRKRGRAFKREKRTPGTNNQEVM